MSQHLHCTNSLVVIIHAVLTKIRQAYCHFTAKKPKHNELRSMLIVVQLVSDKIRIGM